MPTRNGGDNRNTVEGIFAEEFCNTPTGTVALLPTIPTQAARSRLPHGTGPVGTYRKLIGAMKWGAEILPAFYRAGETYSFPIITTNRQSLPSRWRPNNVVPREGHHLFLIKIFKLQI